MNQCARVAHDKGYEYFAVQFYGECYGGKDGGKSFDKHGKSKECWQFDKLTKFGVGKDWTNFVYRIKQVGKNNSSCKLSLGFNLVEILR